ncbi:MAG: hypothetical protein J5699_07740 [Bacteroidales bacterium]|nr:hypothetical protein [Bacteroidales bacterium]
MKRFLLFSAVLLICCSAYSQTCKVTLTAPEGVSVRVYQGFGDSLFVGEPISSTAHGSNVDYVYELKPGRHHFIASGEGRYWLQKNFLAEEGKVIDADPGLKGGKGYEPSRIYAHTDETAANALDITELTKKYPGVLAVPSLKKGKAAQEYTTQEELESFLVLRDDKWDNMYVFFNVGHTTRGLVMPLAVFTTTNLNGMTLEEAAAAVRGNEKPTVYLHAHIHGNEPSAGDGALAMVAELDGKYGKEVLRYVNVIILPRVNGDGAKAWTRGTSRFPDMNRDNLLIDNPEIKAAHRIYNLFLPEVVMDMHEYGAWRNVMRTRGFLDDAGITVSGNQNNIAELNDLMKEMMRYVEAEGAKVGLRYWEYTQGGYSDQAPLHASHYYALRGSTNFLVETPNATLDKGQTHARRVMTQFFAAKALIDYTIEHRAKIQGAVRADRVATVAKGLAGSDPLVLKHGQNEEAYKYTRKFFDFRKGEVLTDSTFAVRYYEVREIERERPTAYVIPKNVRNAERILEVMRYNDITWTELPKGEKMTLRKYAAGDEQAKPRLDVLCDEQEYTFPEGAYLFPMGQESGIILGMLMEPDFVMTDSFPISLVQARLLTRDDVYRCERKL